MIDGIREKYDPAARLVRPHITLVFPFVSALGADAVRDHMREALKGVPPFAIALQGISAQRGFGNYLLLNVHVGKNTIKQLHRKLYSGILEPFKPVWCRTYEPHLTVGRMEDADTFERALEDTKSVDERFETIVNKICVEVIEADGSSTIETVVPLAGL